MVGAAHGPGAVKHRRFDDGVRTVRVREVECAVRRVAAVPVVGLPARAGGIALIHRHLLSIGGGVCAPTLHQDRECTGCHVVPANVLATWCQLTHLPRGV
jgi:hypothetical protein